MEIYVINLVQLIARVEWFYKILLMAIENDVIVLFLHLFLHTGICRVQYFVYFMCVFCHRVLGNQPTSLAVRYFRMYGVGLSFV